MTIWARGLLVSWWKIQAGEESAEGPMTTALRGRAGARQRRVQEDAKAPS